MGKHILNRMCLLLAVVMMAGCVSTPEKRIAKNPDLFGSFPAEVQACIRKGQVAIGFTPDMVRLAMGEPDRVNVRTTATGETELWVYTSVSHYSTFEQGGVPCGYVDRYGRWIRGYNPGWVTVEHEYPLLRIEFEAGKAKAIERLK
jgi:hypothetical protein